MMKLVKILATEFQAASLDGEEIIIVQTEVIPQYKPLSTGRPIGAKKGVVEYKSKRGDAMSPTQRGCLERVCDGKEFFIWGDTE